MKTFTLAQSEQATAAFNAARIAGFGRMETTNTNIIVYESKAEWDAAHPASTDRALDYDAFRDRWPSINKWLDTWEFARTNAAAWRFMVRLAFEDRGVVLNSQRVADFLQLLVDNNVLTNNQRNGILA